MHVREAPAQVLNRVRPAPCRLRVTVADDLGDECGKFLEIGLFHAVAGHFLGAGSHPAGGGKTGVVRIGLRVGDYVIGFEQAGDELAASAGRTNQHLVGFGELACPVAFQRQAVV